MKKPPGFSLLSNCLFLLIFLALAGPLQAATVIEIMDLEQRLREQRILDEKIRLERYESGYMLINMKNKSFHTVEPDEKRVIDMTSFYGKSDATADSQFRIKLGFEKVGKGPRIAGFKTTRYKMKINDFVCADVYLSEEAYELEDVQTLFHAYAYMAGKEAMMGVSGDGDPCERAEFEMSQEQYRQYGVPMKTVSRDGHVDHEIKQVKTNAKVKSSVFTLPKSYEVLEFETLHKLME